MECFCSVICRAFLTPHRAPIPCPYLPITFPRRGQGLQPLPVHSCSQLQAPEAGGSRQYFLLPRGMFWTFREELGPGALILLPDNEGRIPLPAAEGDSLQPKGRSAWNGGTGVGGEETAQRLQVGSDVTEPSCFVSSLSLSRPWQQETRLQRWVPRSYRRVVWM